MLATVDSLPDELIREILSYILCVSGEDFAKTGSSPFGRNSVSSSDLLLINKRWLRIGTSLLYECVVLRNTPQAEALWYALKGKSGSQLKCLVRRMRLEGTFGTAVGRILIALPSIKELFLKLPSDSGEKVNGIMRGLPRLNPARVIFEFCGFSLWKNSYLMAEALCGALRKWTTPLTFELHVSALYLWTGTKDDELTRLLRLGDALADAPCLRSAVLSFTPTSEPSLVARFTEVIGKNESLHAIRLLLYNQSAVDQTLDKLSGSPCTKLLQCSFNSCNALPSRSIKGRIPELPDSILRRVIDIDLGSYWDDDFDSARTCFSFPLFLTNYKERSLALFTISKRFYKLSLPLAFRSISIDSLMSLIRVSKRLTRSINLYFSVEGVRFTNLTYDVDTFRDKDREMIDYESRQLAKSIIGCMFNIREITVSSQTVFMLDDMPEEIRQGLRRLRLDVTEELIKQKTLSQFPNLTHLALSLGRVGAGLNIEIDDERDRPCFRNVISVVIDDHHDLVALHVLRSCDFPSARSVDVILPEVKVIKPAELPSDLLPRFPALRTLSLSGIIQGPYIALLRAQQSNLELIKQLSGHVSRARLCERDVLDRYIASIFNNIELSKARALKELQLFHVQEWPWQDRELKDSTWQDFAQALINTYGIKITNASGIPWRPRMLRTPKN